MLNRPGPWIIQLLVDLSLLWLLDRRRLFRQRGHQLPPQPSGLPPKFSQTGDRELLRRRGEVRPDPIARALPQRLAVVRDSWEFEANTLNKEVLELQRQV